VLDQQHPTPITKPVSKQKYNTNAKKTENKTQNSTITKQNESVLVQKPRVTCRFENGDEYKICFREAVAFLKILTTSHSRLAAEMHL
jgi:hypothetical protein